MIAQYVASSYILTLSLSVVDTMSHIAGHRFVPIHGYIIAVEATISPFVEITPQVDDVSSTRCISAQKHVVHPLQ